MRRETVDGYCLRTLRAPSTVYRWIKQGKLTAKKVHGPHHKYTYWLIETPIDPQPLRRVK